MFNKMATAAVALALALTAANFGASSPAVAQKKKDINYEHIINLAGMQRMITQQLSKETILVAMGVDSATHTQKIKASHGLFDRTLKGLRTGDVALQLPPTRNPKILANLDRVEELWSLFDSALQEAMATGAVSRASVAIVADLSVPLMKAMHETVQEYKREAAGEDLFSMMAVAVDTGSYQRMLTQKMAKEFLLVAYGHDVRKNRESLKVSMKEFESTLASMIDGNFEVRLLPAPTPAIRQQLRKVQAMWDRFRPLMEGATAGGKITSKQILRATELNLTLLGEMNRAVQMYEEL